MSDVLRISGPEQALVDRTLADAGLPPAVGVHSFQVFRASKDVPEITDQRGWTYHHHVDMACWKGRLYVAWNSCERDEDVWPSRELYSTSTDGNNWAPPAELFPQGISTPLRIYFYLPANGRMLVIAGLRLSHDDTDEDKKGALVVREILKDHSLGACYVLQGRDVPKDLPRFFEESTDGGFKDACRALLGDHIYLEQQDRGKLLAKRKMKWHEPAAWPGGKVPGDNEKWVAGKAFSFFQRPDNVWVGVSKMGWTTFSHDQGKTWSQPAVPESLVTGKAKVWGQRTRDGKFALVYNPSRSNRFPLVVVTGEDGVNFGNMRIVQGELPVQRYAGLHRSIGPQYVRGISHWADDRTRDDGAMWLVYSMNKEDIWVSRVPLPIVSAPGNNPVWNTYCPKWASLVVDGDNVEMKNTDPYDDPLATLVFVESTRVAISFESLSNDASLEMDLMTEFGSRRPVRMKASELNLPSVQNQVVSIRIEADAERQVYSIIAGGRVIVKDREFDEPAKKLARVCFRLGEFRGIGGARPVAAGSDRPMKERSCRISKFSVAAT